MNNGRYIFTELSATRRQAEPRTSHGASPPAHEIGVLDRSLQLKQCLTSCHGGYPTPGPKLLCKSAGGLDAALS